MPRYQPDPPQNTVLAILLGLGSFADVNDDLGLPVDRVTVESYWIGRSGQVAELMRT